MGCCFGASLAPSQPPNLGSQLKRWWTLGSHIPIWALHAWDLRNNVSFYDGLYVALAEQLAVALITADRRLAGATGAQCPIDPV